MLLTPYIAQGGPHCKGSPAVNSAEAGRPGQGTSHKHQSLCLGPSHAAVTGQDLPRLVPTASTIRNHLPFLPASRA